ncbi:MAG: alpha/beta hydrolase, partial [Leptospira sp.]|nr:alpha/beta hydrolase [Leptospira sp.]
IRSSNTISEILIVPGLFSGGLFYNRLRRKLENSGYRVEIAKLNPFLLSERKKIAELAFVFKSASHGLKVIAHNTGGLLTIMLPDESRQKIDSIITLGTPFQGSHLFRIFPPFFSLAKWKYDSAALKSAVHNTLLINNIFPFAAISDFIFRPKGSTEFGQGRDWWFDIPGNLNLVRRKENLRTLIEFMEKNLPPKEQSGKNPVPPAKEEQKIKAKKNLRKTPVKVKKSPPKNKKPIMKKKPVKIKRRKNK